MWTLSFAHEKPSRNQAGANGNTALIDLRGVDKNYKTAVGDFPALKNVDLHIEAGCVWRWP